MQAAPIESEPARGSRDTARILVVDDEPAVRETLEELLAAEGYDVVVASSGEAAFPLVDEVDLIVLDAMLPGRDGWQICQEIKARDASIPVLMVTARTSPADVVRTFEAGADDYIAKPFSAAELSARIGTRLRVHGVERALRRANDRLSELADQNYRLYEKASADAEERAALLRELDHRVRNNLSILTGLLTMERNRRPQRSPSEGLASLERRFRAFLVVHDISREQGYHGVPVPALVDQLTQRLRQALDPEGRITLELDCEAFCISMKHAVALAVSLNELVSNAMIHGFDGRDAGRVRVAARRHGDRVVVEVQDNGVGQTGGSSGEAVVGSGRSIVEALIVGELGGQIEYLPKSVGTHAVLTFADGPEAPPA